MKLDTWERVMLTEIIGNMRGDYVTITHKAGKLLDLIELTEDEKKEIGFVRFGNGNVVWQGDKEWEIEIKDRNLLALLNQQVSLFTGWQRMDKDRVKHLREKLGIPEPPSEA